MVKWDKQYQDNDMRKSELINIIEHSINLLSLEELEALYYDMLTKDYIQEISYSDNQKGD